MTRIVSLVGYRGTGKSTLAPDLARRLEWDFADTDLVVERTAGRSISEIFASDGEAGFRRLERAAVAELLTREKLVLSLGGGAILDDKTRAEIRAAGPVVWLRASVDTIARRLGLDEHTATRRPRLTDQNDPREEIRQVLAARTGLYADAASIVVDTDNMEPDAVTESVYQHVTGALGLGESREA